jgi:signal transduction histidine kinase
VTTEQQSSHLELATLLAKQLGAPINLTALMEQAVDIFFRHFPVAAIYFYQPSSDGGWKLLTARQGDYTIHRAPRTMMVVRHMQPHAQRTGTAALTSTFDLNKEGPPPHFHPETERRLLALEVAGQVVALLDLYTRDGLNAEQSASLDALCVPLAHTIQQATKTPPEKDPLAVQLGTAAEVSQRITSILNIDQLLTEVCRLISRNFGYYYTQVFLFDPHREQWMHRAGAGDSMAERAIAGRQYALDNDEGIPGFVGARGMALMAGNVQHEQFYKRAPHLPETQAEMAVPLRVGASVLGVLDVHSRYANTFSQHDIAIIETLGNQVAMALNNAELFGEVENQLKERERLYNAAAAISAAQDADSLLGAMMGNLAVPHIVRGGILLPDKGQDEANNALFVAAVWNPTNNPLLIQPGTKLQANLLPSLYYMATDTIQMVGDVGGDERLDEVTRAILKQIGASAVALVPLRAGGTVLGWLLLMSNKYMGFDAELLRPYQTLADQAALAIERVQLLNETQLRARRLAALTDLSANIVASLDLSHALQESVVAMAKLFGVKQSGLLLYERNNSVGRLMAQYREDGYHHEQEILVPVMGNPLIEKMLATRQPVYVRDVEHDPLAVTIRAGTHPRSYVGMLVIPLLSPDRVIGSISLDVVKGHEREFTAEDIELAQTMATQLAAAIENAHLYHDATRRAHDVETAAQVGQRLTQMLNEEELLKAVARLIADRFEFHHVAIYLRDDPYAGRLSVRAAAGAVGDTLTEKGHIVWEGQGVVGVALQRKAIVAANDVADEPAFERHPLLPATAAQAALPLTLGGEVLGVLDVHSTRLDPFSKDMVTVLATIADQLVVALQNARLFASQREVVAQLREVDRLKSEFLASMSHELRTPLNSIIGFSKLLLRGTDNNPLTTNQQADVSSIYRSGQHLLSLINDILDLSKIAAGRMELSRREVAVPALVDDVAQTVAPQVAEAKLRLETAFEENLPPIHGDATRIRQILLNLVSNAIKFTEKGAVVIGGRRVSTAKPNDGRKECIGDPHGGFVEISVRDTGIGIREEDQETIFEEFRQLNGTHPKRAGGTGLGLAIARRFTELHGGWLWVDSRSGVGSTFRITIPVAEAYALLPTSPNGKMDKAD